MRSKPTHWDRIRKELRPKFAAAGLLEICELGLDGCLANKNGLVPKTFQTFAHSLRRRKIDKHKKSDPEEYERLMKNVIRACVNCHDIIDNKLEDDSGHEKAEAIVNKIIRKRKRQPE